MLSSPTTRPMPLTGMGSALAREFEPSRRVFEQADEALGFALSRLCFEGPEEELRLALNPQGQQAWLQARPRGTIDHLKIGVTYNSADPRPAPGDRPQDRPRPPRKASRTCRRGPNVLT